MINREDEDRELRARFEVLRMNDAASAPPFDVAWDGARARASRMRSWQLGGAALVLTAAAALGLVVIARPDGDQAALSTSPPLVAGDPEPLGFLLEPLPGDAWAIGPDEPRSER